MLRTSGKCFKLQRSSSNFMKVPGSSFSNSWECLRGSLNFRKVFHTSEQLELSKKLFDLLKKYPEIREIL